MKKNIYISLIIAFFGTQGFAQQIEQSNLYEFNKLKINPAYAGTEACGNVSIGHLAQWAGFEGSPQTSYVNGSGHIGRNMAFGGKVALDRLGGLTRFNAQAIYSYRLNFGTSHNLRLGIGAGINQHNFNLSGSTVQDWSDPALQAGYQRGISFYSEFGFVYSLKKFQLSFSLPNLVETRTNLDPTSGEVKNVRHMIAYMGYEFGNPSKVTFTPSVLYKNSELQLHQLEGNLMVNFNNRFQIGAGYRHNAGVLGRVGLNINDLVQVRYAYEFPLSDISRATTGSHEVSIGLRICKQSKSLPVDVIDPIAQETRVDTFFVDKIVEVEKIVEKEVEVTKVAPKLNHTIYYAHASSDFDANKEEAELQKIADYLKANRDQGIYIQGFASVDGSEYTNFKLSAERSKKVYAYLLSKGVERKQMISVSQGEVNEYNTIETNSDQDKNRRVTIVSW